MQHVVCHVEKCQTVTTGLGQHVDRLKVSDNVDQSRTNLNEDLTPRRSDNLTDDVNARIAEGYKGKKGIRKDAVKAFRIILSGSNERMKEIERNPHELQAWKELNVRFMQEKFGAGNLVRMSLHMDETTPHIHAVVVPITPDGRLSAKDFIDGPKGLRELHTQYSEAMKIFGLSRGKENSTAKHTDIAEYYGRVNNQENLFPEVEIPSKKFLESDEDFQKRGQKMLSPVYESLEKAKRINGQLRGDNKRLTNEVSSLRKSLLEHYQRGAKDMAQGVNRGLEKKNLDFRVKAVEHDKGISLDWVKKEMNQEQKNARKKDLGLGM